MTSYNQRKGENRYSVDYFVASKNIFAGNTFALCFFWLSITLLCPTASFPAQMPNTAGISPSSVLKKCWQNSIVTKNIPIASDNDDNFFLLSEDNKLQSIESDSGDVNWGFEIGGTIISNLFISEDFLYVAGSEETAETAENSQKRQKNKQVFLRSISIVSGIPAWSAETDLKNKIVQESFQEADKKIYLGENGSDIILLDSSGNLFFADKNKGSLEWSRTFDSAVSEFLDFHLNGNKKSDPSQKIFAFYAANKKLYLVMSKTGELLDGFAHPHTVTSTAMLSTSDLIIGDEKGNVSLLKIGSKNAPVVLWNIKVGAGVSSLSLNNEGVLITSLDNFVYLINPIKGNRIWKKRLSGRLLYQPLIIESKKTFIVVENESAYFMNLENGAIVNRITLEAGKYFINTPVSLAGKYIFPTNSGIIAYSDSQCS
jgi:outer membrane protein assembly factor BamB